MEIFLDSSDIKEIRGLNKANLIDGVTTNPSLLASAGTDFKILLKEDHNKFNVIFDMLSLRIEDDEIVKICQKKFRAKSAIQYTEEGKGIGMSRVLKTLKLNNAEIEIKPRITNYSKIRNNNIYEHNQFILKFDSNRLI